MNLCLCVGLSSDLEFYFFFTIFAYIQQKHNAMGFTYNNDFKQFLSLSLLPYGVGMLKAFHEEFKGIPFTLKKGDVLTFVDNSGLAVLMFQLIEDKDAFNANMLMGYVPGSVVFRDHKKHSVMPVLKMAKCRLPMEVEMEWYFKQNIV